MQYELDDEESEIIDRIRRIKESKELYPKMADAILEESLGYMKFLRQNNFESNYGNFVIFLNGRKPATVLPTPGMKDCFDVMIESAKNWAERLVKLNLSSMG